MLVWELIRFNASAAGRRDGQSPRTPDVILASSCKQDILFDKAVSDTATCLYQDYDAVFSRLFCRQSKVTATVELMGVL